MKPSDFLHWKETNEADKIEYYNDNRKHGIIEVFCRIKLPYKFYEVANMLSIIYEAKSFDDYVSGRIYEEIERYIQHGTEPIGDAVLSHITSKETEWHSAEEKKEVKEKVKENDLGLISKHEADKWLESKRQQIKQQKESEAESDYFACDKPETSNEV